MKILDTSLSSVDPELLVQAVTQLEKVELVGTRLTPQQVEAIFAALDTSSQMKKLRIRSNNLSSVDPDVLARVVNKLETVDITITHLTEQQKIRILTRSLLTTNLKELYMWGNGGVEEGLGAQAEQFIENLYLLL